MEAIWPGSGSAVSGNTPFGLYDTDSTFQWKLIWKSLIC